MIEQPPNRFPSHCPYLVPIEDQPAEKNPLLEASFGAKPPVAAHTPLPTPLTHRSTAQPWSDAIRDDLSDF